MAGTKEGSQAIVTTDLAVPLMRLAWLTLTGMMLLSRVAFQLAGPVRMRAFLDTWKGSTTKRWWGALALACGVVLAAFGLAEWSSFDHLEQVLFVLVTVVLIGDGLLNVLPGSFGKFKETMQDAWVRRRGGGAQSSDAALFGMVNLLLGLASVAMAALVALYEPADVRLIAVSLAIALLLTTVLILGALRERRAGGAACER